MTFHLYIAQNFKFGSGMFISESELHDGCLGGGVNSMQASVTGHLIGQEPVCYVRTDLSLCLAPGSFIGCIQVGNAKMRRLTVVEFKSSVVRLKE